MQYTSQLRQFGVNLSNVNCVTERMAENAMSGQVRTTSTRFLAESGGSYVLSVTGDTTAKSSDTIRGTRDAKVSRRTTIPLGFYERRGTRVRRPVSSHDLRSRKETYLGTHQNRMLIYLLENKLIPTP